MSSDFDVLDQFTARRSDDDVKRELELTCDTCGVIVCDVEDGDLLSTLANVADDHWEEFHFQLRQDTGEEDFRGRVFQQYKSGPDGN